jgi:hypothetical protein
VTGREKLGAFDAQVDGVRDELVRMLTEEWEQLLAVARGRHAWGHYRYGDRLMYEYTDEELAASTVARSE